MKKQKLVLAALLMVSVLLAGQPAMAVAQSSETKASADLVKIPESIWVNGKALNLNNSSIYEKNGHVMVPLRAAAEALGYDVKWIGSENSVELNLKAQWTKIKIGEDSYFFTKMAPFKLGAAPEMKKSGTYVPLEFFTEVLKCDVDMSKENAEISINRPKYSVNDKLSIPELKLSGNTYVSDYKFKDINGDKVKDHIIVAGVREYDDSLYCSDVILIVQDGKTREYMEAAIDKDAGGYGASAFVGDFNGDKVDDVLIGMPTGGSGGIIQYALFSFKENKPHSLFDFEKFNQGIDLKVKFLPDFKTELRSDTLDKTEILDLAYNEAMYVGAGIYDNEGKILQSTEGWTDSYGELKPVDIDLDGSFELIGTQRICGCCHADSIAYLITTWKWAGQKMNLEQAGIAMPLMTKEGDVNGNGSIDKVTLMGTKEFGSDSLYVRDLKIQINDEKDFIYEEFTLTGNNEGYAPELFLGIFNDDKAEEMLISVYSGGSGGMSTYSLISFKGNKAVHLLDQDKFSKGLDFDVIYKDHFKADIFVKEMNKTYTLDISSKKSLYVEGGIYNEQGKMLMQPGGMSNPLSDLKAVDADNDGILELVGTQRALGTANADTLGYVQSIWKIDNDRIKLVDVKVSESID